MDRLRVWIESRHSSMSTDCDGPYIINTRPPPLRTSNTYDDDEAFSNVSLNLLSRYQALGLSSREAILGTLVSPKQRASYFEGLCGRLDRLPHLSTSMTSLVQSIDKIFGDDLRQIVKQENHDYHNPTVPRNVGLEINDPIAPQESQCKDKKFSRRFFPEHSDPIKSLFFRKKKIQNIDWKLAQAIERVESLRLDGDEGFTATNTNTNDMTWKSTTTLNGHEQHQIARGSYQPPNPIA